MTNTLIKNNNKNNLPPPPCYIKSLHLWKFYRSNRKLRDVGTNSNRIFTSTFTVKVLTIMREKRKSIESSFSSKFIYFFFLSDKFQSVKEKPLQVFSVGRI